MQIAITPQQPPPVNTVLCSYLSASPALFSCHLTDSAKKQILRECYASLYGNDPKLTQFLFPNGFDDSLLSMASGDSNVLDKERDMPEYSEAQRGMSCGHVLKKGESVYRCRNCGLDETCVLCTRCYRATDHEGHDVSFIVSPGGGCCDCGDPEAWRVPVHCKYHFANTTSAAASSALQPQMPSELLTAVRSTIATILDFVLETFATSPSTIAAPIDKQAVEREARQTALATSGALPPAASTKEQAKEEYACVLWNDKNHTFRQAIETVMEGSGCTREQAEAIVQQVDSRVCINVRKKRDGQSVLLRYYESALMKENTNHIHVVLYAFPCQGREIIEQSDDIDRLLKIATVVSRVGLAVTVRSARDTFREHLASVLLLWLKELTCGRLRPFPRFHDATAIMRNVLCEELCSEWKRGGPAAATQRAATPGARREEEEQEDEEMIYTDDEEGRDERGEEVKAGGDDVVMEEPGEEGSEGVELDADVNITEAEWEVMRNGGAGLEEEGLEREAWPGIEREGYQTFTYPYEDFTKKLRLDWIMLFDRRLWKEARISMRDIIIRTLIIHPEYKKICGIRFARNYLKLADSYLFKDREPEHTIFLLSLQIFTVPKLAALLVDRYNFLGTLYCSLQNLFAYDAIIPTGNQHLIRRINMEMAQGNKNQRYFQLFQDLRYLLNSEPVKQSIPRHSRYLTQYLDFVAAFQGMDVQVRQTEQHVEYESETWANAFNITVQLVKSVRQFAECFGADPRVLGFAIRRLMRRLHWWAVRRPEETEALRIYAAAVTDIDQAHGHSFRVIETPHAGAHRVLEFEVAVQPVSFHHPMHWLLAELLENVELLGDVAMKAVGWEGFKQMILGFDTGTKGDIETILREMNEKVLAILDYPLRSVVLLAQMRAGVWAHHYREVSLRENTYDADLLLLQTGFVLFDPDLFLLTIVDRFQLLNWFNGKQTHKIYDAAQTVYMIEELLDVLIVCAGERDIPMGMSLEDRIRREIIHGLYLAPLSYSEITKRIPERLCENPKYDQLLAELANFRAPEGLHDFGVYELKEQYYDEVDPYFFHYSRNSRAEAEQMLKKRWKKRGESRSFLVPRSMFISKGPFVRLGNMLHAKLMIQVILYALWNVKNDRKMNNDLIIDEALHLAMLALVDENNDYVIRSNKGKGKQRENAAAALSDADVQVRTDGAPGFVHHATFDDYAVMGELEPEHVTLLRVLLRYLDDTSWKEVHDKVEWIVNRIHELGSATAKAEIDEYRWRKTNPSLTTGATDAAAADVSGMTEVERKKQLAKESKEKMLAAFAQARVRFEENNFDLDDSDEEDDLMKDYEVVEGEVAPEAPVTESKSSWKFPSGTCIVCQEETGQHALYGMLCLVQPSNMLRQTPLEDDRWEFLKEVLETPETLDTAVPLAYNTKGFPPNKHIRGPYISTCGHLMHAHCFETYVRSLDARQQAYPNRNHPENLDRREFLCPLCKSLGNIMLPIEWKTKTESFPGVLGETSVDEFQQWLGYGVEAAIIELQPSTVVKLESSVPERRSSGTILSNLQFMFRPFSSSSATPVSNDRRERKPGNSAAIDSVYSHIDANNIESSSSSAPASSKPSNATVASVVGEPVMIRINAPGRQETYGRITEVLQIVCGGPFWTEEGRVSRDTYAVKSIDLLWESLSYTISCVEIAHRGTGGMGESSKMANHGTLIDTIPESTLTLLRVLSETIMTYYSVMGDGESSCKLQQLTAERLRQLFYNNKSAQQLEVGPRNPYFESGRRNGSLKPLLQDDPFQVLVEAAMYMVPALDIKVSYLIRLLYLAEVLKTIIALVRTVGGTPGQGSRIILNEARAKLQQQQNSPDPTTAAAMREFVSSVMETFNFPRELVACFFDIGGDIVLSRLLDAYLLPFLRKCTVFLYARFGVNPESAAAAGISRDTNEFDRLREYLRLPTIGELILSLQRSPALIDVVTGWLHDLRNHSRLPEKSVLGRITLNHPAIFNLVELPHRFETLLEESSKHVCSNCNTVPQDPAICLLCGTFVCFQSFCCLEDEIGECSRHRVGCSGEVGIYIVVRKGTTLLLCEDIKGTFVNLPYLDAHGEVDILLKYVNDNSTARPLLNDVYV
ncbi:hypothetical protein BC937DRAFT_89041 [Endogone sp. FLAS-F59071]|nr:hypothetical protein BC937DRAFT_89041 [Endogone sp. FLAS-F59071]|eukprot:RUS18204.1 hypothetical protein BC937DRAFT_89041 [Endogone sp. FLAS-F59071]